MNGDLLQNVSGNSRVSRIDRPVTAQGRRIYDEVRLSAFKAQYKRSRTQARYVC
jgi:hypothetical protein